MTGFQCKWDCGTTLHYDNGRVLDGSNTYHNCPNAPWRRNPSSFETAIKLLEQQAGHLARIADALELLARK